MTLPCRCDRGSSAYQIDGDCLAVGAGAAGAGGAVLAGRKVSVDSS